MRQFNSCENIAANTQQSALNTMSGTINGSPWSIVDGDDGDGGRKVLIFTNGDGDIFINRGGLHLRILSYRLRLTNMV